MAWYGVNFVLGAGLHSYGFGGGGQEYVFGAIGVQLLYVGIALLASGSRPVAASIPAQQGAAALPAPLDRDAEVVTQS
jgi:hypothetical protein